MECPPGSYCEGQTASPEPCPEGTFSDAPGRFSRSQCQDCPAGYYCGTKGLTNYTGSCKEGEVLVLKQKKFKVKVYSISFIEKAL